MLRRYFGKISPLQIGNLIGHNGELVIDETDNSVYIMDGTTFGGYKIFDGHVLQQDLQNIDANIKPSINNYYSLGNASNQWSDIYLSNSLVLNNAALTVSNGNLYINGTNVTNTTQQVVTVDIAPPDFAGNGQLWYSTTDGRMYTSYSNEWIDANPAIIPPPSTYISNLSIDDTTISTNKIGGTIYIDANLIVNGSPVVTSASDYGNAQVVAYLSTFNGNIGNLTIDSTVYSPDVWVKTKHSTNNIYISPDDINTVYVPNKASNLQTVIAGYGNNGIGLFAQNAYVLLSDVSNDATGNVVILTSQNTGNYKWTFDNNGNLILPKTNTITAASSTLSPTGTEITGLTASLGYGTPYQYVFLSPNQTFTDWFNLGSSIIGWTIFSSGNPSSAVTVTQYLNNDLGGPSLGFSGALPAAPWDVRSANYVAASTEYNPVVISTNNNAWTFGVYGNLTLPVGGNISYTPNVSSDWNGTPPTTIQEALDRIAIVVKSLNGGTGA